MTDSGWIKLYRCLPDKAIWHESTPEHKAVLIAIMVMANHQERQWTWNGEKFEAKPGQFVSSLEGIRRVAGKGVSTKNVRTALTRFTKLQFLENESTKTGRKVTIKNWGRYQAPEIDRQRLEFSDEQSGQKTAKQPAKPEGPEEPVIPDMAKDAETETGKADGNEVAKEWQSTGKGPASNKNERMKECKKLKDKTEAKQARAPIKEITNLYQEKCKSLPQIREVTEKRKDAIRSRWKKYNELDLYRELFERAEASDFLSGRSGKWTGCNFDWLINEANMIKVLEGNYDRDRAAKDKPQAWDNLKEWMERGN